jgi:hypothetical protein
MQKQGGRTVKEKLHEFSSVSEDKKHIPVISPGPTNKEVSEIVN